MIRKVEELPSAFRCLRIILGVIDMSCVCLFAALCVVCHNFFFGLISFEWKRHIFPLLFAFCVIQMQTKMWFWKTKIASFCWLFAKWSSQKNFEKWTILIDLISILNAGCWKITNLLPKLECQFNAQSRQPTVGQTVKYSNNKKKEEEVEFGVGVLCAFQMVSQTIQLNCHQDDFGHTTSYCINFGLISWL